MFGSLEKDVVCKEGDTLGNSFGMEVGNELGDVGDVDIFAEFGCIDDNPLGCADGILLV